MNALQFASLSQSTHSAAVAKKQALVAASKRYDDLLDADPCSGRCKCPEHGIDQAKKEYDQAYDSWSDAAASWADYCAIRQADVR